MMQPCASMPVTTVSNATTNQPRADSEKSPSPAIDAAMGPAVSRPSGIMQAMKSMTSTPRLRARFDVNM